MSFQARVKMAYESARLEELRKAINSVRPNEPDLAASFSVEDLQSLLDAGIISAQDFRDVGVDNLRELGIDEALASARLHELRKAINSVRPDEPDLAASFSTEDFQSLLEAGITRVGDFRDARADDLREVGLDEARVTDLKPGSRPSEQGSLGKLLRAPLPPARFSDLPMAKCHPSGRHKTHPTKVEEWPGWEVEVKERLRNGTKGWITEGYTLTGNDAYAYIDNKSGVWGSFLTTAGFRMNCVFGRQELPFRFTTHPDLRPSDQQDTMPERDLIDVCLVDTTEPEDTVLQATVCRFINRLEIAEQWSMPAVWTAWKDGKAVHDAVFAEDVQDALAEVLGFMSEYGHVTGTISTYLHTWLLRTDKKGTIQVTPAVRHDQEGTCKKVSVTEMLLYSALSNIYSEDKEPYPTAISLGAAPSSYPTANSPGAATIFCNSVKASRKRARGEDSEKGLQEAPCMKK